MGRQERYTTTRGHSGRLGEFDAEELLAVTREAMDEAEREAGDVDAVAISCFWHSLVGVDGRGRAITPVLTWRQVDRAAPVPLDSDAVHARTGCPLHPSFWPMKIAGLNAQGVRPARFLSFSDLLTGGRTSLSMASGTGLLGLDGRWDEELLATLGLEAAQLPELADELVLGDGAAANLGSGVLGWTRGALTIGTSAALRTVARAEHSPAGPLPLPRRRGARDRGRRDLRRRQPARLARAAARHRGDRRARPPIAPASSTSSRCLEENAAPAGARTPAARSPGSRSARSRGTSSVPRSRESRTASPRSPPSCPSWRRSSARAARSSTAPTGRRSSPTCWSCR